MRIGAALALIAVGAILRFALSTVFSHGVYLHTVGDILMAVGVLGLILWFVMWGPWARNRTSTYRQSTARVAGSSQVGPSQVGPNQVGPNQVGPNQVGSYPAEESRYEERRTYEDRYPS